MRVSALVNEAFIRLMTGSQNEMAGQRSLLRLCLPADAPGPIVPAGALAGFAGKRRSVRRGRRGRRNQAVGDINNLIDLDAALDAALEELTKLNERQARVLKMRSLGGLEKSEVAGALSVCGDTVMHAWKFARAWLFDGCKRPKHSRVLAAPSQALLK